MCIFEDTGGNYDEPLKLSEGRNSSISMSRKRHKILCMCCIKAFKGRSQMSKVLRQELMNFHESQTLQNSLHVPSKEVANVERF